jgi:hypothetical protein
VSSPAIPALGASFQEPSSPDQTSGPPEQVPQAPMQSQNPIAQILKKKKGFGANVKNPGALAGAISRAKRARQTGQKWGL